ncbi:hypothetical protein BRE01_67270 [Brevibacillus reuszeri]|uniref:Uncharacterized protein n=1 Tax=Brevibacillus reuszeri TaxID=54915 RepID=A0A0K9YN86_9BACL|nr:hypothetical protein [Brevibacillus reuszeri]KNB70179.1 hypothetical protein ADS79_14505 [Brevibacillus reuszeri]GED73025.1 hypothetical protein BRE01_67270 [Brevibacillus reuszeri]
MRANVAKEITQNAETDNAIKWYEGFKEILFEAIKNQAESRSYSLTIGENNAKLNQYEFISYGVLRDKLQIELEGLGYGFEYINHREGSYITISWN